MTREQVTQAVRQVDLYVDRAVQCLPDCREFPAGSAEARSLIKMRDALLATKAHARALTLSD